VLLLLEELGGSESFPATAQVGIPTGRTIGQQAIQAPNGGEKNMDIENAAPAAADTSEDTNAHTDAQSTEQVMTSAEPGYDPLRAITPSQVQPAQGDGEPSLVFALGAIGYDLMGESRRDSLAQHLEGDPNDPAQLLAYLETNAWDAETVTWTLNLDATPIYAVKPTGAFANSGYERLRQFLGEQLTEGVERVSIPGVIAGQVQLFSGQIVPLIAAPELRCMYSWTTAALVESVCGEAPDEKKAASDYQAYVQKREAVANFLERVYHELRNLGISSQERAINYAAANALNVSRIFEAALKEEMELDAIEAEPSPICRPGSDCWEIRLTFFNPARVFEQARKVYRFSVDVSDVCPVMVGDVRSWYVR
jgi:cyanobactin maturation PatA/PatG family protease